MISIDEELMIKTLLSQENADDIVRQMVLKYAELSVDNARNLLSMVSGIADKAIKNVSEKASENAQAAFWLINQRKMEQDTNGTFFASMVPVCKAMFSDGTCDGRSRAEQEYWSLFLEQFMDKKIFSWERDKNWADSYGYTQYLKLVEENLAI